MSRPPTALSSTGGQSRNADGSQYPSPPRPEVQAFHAQADTDSDLAALHHTLGPASSQSAPGDHTHDGGSSSPLFQGQSIVGTRGSTAYYQSIEALLVAKGAANQAT